MGSIVGTADLKAGGGGGRCCWVGGSGCNGVPNAGDDDRAALSTDRCRAVIASCTMLLQSSTK